MQTPLSIRTELESLLRAEGFGSALPSRPVLESAEVDRLPTGIPDVDARLGGGVPVGAMTEVAGAPSSGRTGMVWALLASVTSRHEIAAYVDAMDAFDPWCASRRGVELSRVLWVQCRGRVETAFKAADVVIRGGGARVVVLDLAGVPISRLRRIPAAAYVRLRRAVEHTPAALIMLTDQGLAGTAAAVTIQRARASAVWSGRHPTVRVLNGFCAPLPLVRGRGLASRRAG